MLFPENELREHLVTAGLVRKPNVAGSLPVCYVSPAGGLIAPGQGQSSTERSDVTMSIKNAGGVPDGTFQAYYQLPLLTIDIRCANDEYATAVELANDIRQLISHRRGFDMGSLRVQQCKEFASMTLVDSDPILGYHFSVTYELRVLDRNLAA